MLKAMKILAPACIAASMLISPLALAEAPHAEVKTLTTKALSDIPGKEGLMISVYYPPGAVDPVHRHNAHAFVYVLEGEIIMGVKGGKEVTLKAGDTFYEAPTDLHTVGRNASKTKPAKFTVLLVKDAGKDFFIPTDK